MNNRNLRFDWIQAGSLKGNPANWRKHPDGQLNALRELIVDDDEVGWAGALLYNERTGRLIDGHGRLKIVAPDHYVPVLIGNWSEEAEKKILLTLDPLASLATADVEQLAALMDEVDLTTPGLEGVLESLDKLVGKVPSDDAEDASEGSGSSEPGRERYMVIVDCRDEMHQADLLERFSSQGLKVRALIG